MSNFRRVIARISIIVLVFACMAGLAVPAHAEDGNEVIPVTEVNLYIPEARRVRQVIIQLSYGWVLL